MKIPKEVSKEVSREWRWWLFEFIFAGALSTGIGFWTEDIPLSALIFLFIGITCYMLREHRRLTSQFEDRVAEWERKSLDLPVMLSHLENGDPYIKQLVRSAVSEARRLAKGGVDGEIIVRPRSIQQATIDFIRQAKPGEKVFATSYITPSTFWCTPEGDLYRQICFELADRGIEITRVFIESARADDEEIKCVQEEVDRQKGHINLQIRKTKESLLPQEARKDMFLIHDRYVAYLNIGGGNILEELKICTSPEHLEDGKKLAETILRFSNEC